ncbi:MAG TPA: septal ring lytic transglycosylase RlpA family protein [Hyphomicrobium sp.]|nr:septal ring lytic transglycosylase RlpA family protein [Hyphomicrobium sp.]
MRTLFYSAMAAACFGLLAVTPASAENAPWTCMSPAFACGDAPVVHSHRTAFTGNGYGRKIKKVSAERSHRHHAKAETTKAKSGQRLARAEQPAVKPQAKMEVPERKDAQAPAAKQDKQASTSAKAADTKTGEKTAAVAVKPNITVRKVETESTHRVLSTQTGMASYYWQGQMTASGVRFNPNAMTAAHRTLPFGTKVRVTNKRNGKSVIVTINDRGPFIRGRIIDLSNAAAGVIGMRSSGVAPVTVERIGG